MSVSRADPSRVLRFPRPDQLRLELSAEVASVPLGMGEEFGWVVWNGKVVGLWDVERFNEILDAAGKGAAPGSGLEASLEPDHAQERIDDLVAAIVGWGGETARLEEDWLHLPVGTVETWVLPLGLDVREPQTYTVWDAHDVFRAADAMAQDLVDTVAPLTERADEDDLFGPAVGEATGAVHYSQLLLLREAEIDSRFRGMNIGAWAAARVIALFAGSEGTLVACKAAPLDADQFRRLAAGEDRHRDLNPAERAEWDRAQTRISAYWQKHLGLVPLPGAKGILVYGSHLRNQALTATLGLWS